MKIGLVVECGPDGAEEKILPILLRLHDQSIETKSITLNSKAVLMNNAIPSAVNLLNLDGCDKVLVVWDLLPSYPNKSATKCMKLEKDHLLSQMQSLNSQMQNKISLICVENMIEAWLIADARAVKEAIRSLKSAAHRSDTIDFRPSRYPEAEPDPKSRLINAYNNFCSGRRYTDQIHGPQIASHITDFRELKKCASFKRFIYKAFGVNL